MAGTRSSTRGASANTSPSTSQTTPSKGTAQKRKAEATSSPGTKRSKNSSTNDKEQKTIDETMPSVDQDVDEKAMADAADKVENGHGEEHSVKNGHAEDVSKTNGQTNGTNGTNGNHVEQSAKENLDNVASEAAQRDKTQVAAAEDSEKSEQGTEKPGQASARTDESPADKVTDASKMDSTGKVEQVEEGKAKTEPEINGDGAVEESKERRDAMPSNVLEKGLIYFFTRARVNVDDPKSVQDIARSYIVLRPLPQGAKLGEGPIEDLKNNRLLALPKKVLPKSHQDRFMTFVEKAGATIEELKKEFMEGSDYSTKTTGDRHTPAVTPIGEGIYALTSTGRESHLAYILTIPSELGEVQKSMGINERGSFVTSLKNPNQAGPANINLPEGPKFPKEFEEEFRNLRWMPVQPKHLDYANAQLLLIGEAQGELGKAIEPTEQDENNDKKETPLEEMEKLEEEDELRVEGLKGDDAVFEDLNVSKKDYPKLLTTW